MCAITGLYHLKRRPIPAHCLKPMCDVMKHRGPDDDGAVFFHVKDEPFKDEGYSVEKGTERRSSGNNREWDQLLRSDGEFNLALGHRRLSIIDLSSAAHQPMSNRANGLWITYNGEIYNFRELRRELESAGHRFFSKSDTEVIIHLYEEHGEGAFAKLNGIFALALWDSRHNRLLLARDRYGAKPLYYTIQDDLLVFASEVKAILEVDGIRAKLNLTALSDYFTFQNTFGETTLFDGVNLLEPGHYMVVEGDRIVKRQYWDFNFTEGVDRGEDDFVSNFRDKFSSVISRQLVADVPVGCYLSGGLDSGAITAFAARNIPRLMTFTGGFDVSTATSIENFFDERTKAELVSRELGTEHYQMVMHAGDLEWALPRVIWHSEDLRVGMSYPHYYLSQLAGKFVKVVLAGAGGDELLGGYPWRYDLLSGCRTSSEFESATYHYWSRLVKDAQKKDFFSADVLRHVNGHSPLDSMRSMLKSTDTTNFLKSTLYFEAKTFLHGILVIEDKLSMAHSLESRVPFLDHELVDFASAIPSRYLINKTWSDAAKQDINLSGKYILRKAMSGILPRDIVENRKQGFSAPDQTWYMQQLVQYIRQTILSPRALDRGLFRPEYLERVINEHINGKVNHRLLIWSLLSFEWWNRIFIDREPVTENSHQRVAFRRSRPEEVEVREPAALRYH